VVVCVGAGGVGKTTTAAALGLAAAREGRRAVVVTIDPARRLADALGLVDSTGEVSTALRPADRAGPVPGADRAGPVPRAARQGRGRGPRLGANRRLGDEPVLVPGVGPGELWGVMLDPQATFDRLVHQQAHSEEQARRILDNPIYRNLTTSLSGTHEYLAAEKLHELHADDRFDLVIVDTPPARHALDVLDGPSRLIRFLDHRLYRSVFAPRRGIRKAVNTATQTALRSISRLVGADLVDDVIAFFAAFEGLDDGFRRRAAEVNRLLLSPSTGFVLVTSPRYQAMRESDWLLEQLAVRRVPVSAIVVNRMTPELGPPPEPDGLPSDWSAHAQAWRTLHELARVERAALAAVRARHPHLPLVVVEDRGRPVNDLAGLALLGRRLVGS
jgi:anion-transporting  ArsA/GET3 family ATPase